MRDDTSEVGAEEDVVSGDGTRTLLVDGAGSKQFRIIIPEGARLTFGPLIPGMKSGGYGSGASLRVYASTRKDSLLACFSNVLSFRDSAIKVWESFDEVDTAHMEKVKHGLEELTSKVETVRVFRLTE